MRRRKRPGCFDRMNPRIRWILWIQRTKYTEFEFSDKHLPYKKLCKTACFLNWRDGFHAVRMVFIGITSEYLILNTEYFLLSPDSVSCAL